MSILNIIVLSLFAIIVVDKYHAKFEVEQSLAPYYEEFTAKVPCYKPARQIEIVYGQLEEPTIGLCETYPFGWKITVDGVYWNRASDLDKYELMTHELTHCVLNKMHTNDPNDYMYPEKTFIMNLDMERQLQDNIKEYCK